MSKKSINQNSQQERESKESLLNYKHFEDFTEDELLFPISHTFSEFLWEQEAKGNAQATIDYYKRFFVKFKKFIVEFIQSNVEELPTASLVKLKLQGLFVVYLKNSNVNQQTINNYLRAFRSYGNFCQNEGYIQGFKCSIREVEPEIKDVYEDSEIDKLRIKPSRENYEQYRNYNIVSILCATGARCNTILNIKVTDVDLKAGTITFNTTKAHKPIEIPLDRKALKDIREYIMYSKALYEKNGCNYIYLFSNRFGEQLTRGGLSKAIAYYNKSKGVTKTSIHLFRHTFAKKWITSGGDIFTLQKILTHSELDMVKRYLNLYGKDLTNAVNKHSILAQTRTKSGETIRTAYSNNLKSA